MGNTSRATLSEGKNRRTANLRPYSFSVFFFPEKLVVIGLYLLKLVKRP